MDRWSLLEATIVGSATGAACSGAQSLAMVVLHDPAPVPAELMAPWTIGLAAGAAGFLTWLALRAKFFQDSALAPSGAAIAGAIAGGLAEVAAFVAMRVIMDGVRLHLIRPSRFQGGWVALAGLVSGSVAGVFGAWLGRKLSGKQLDW